VPGWNRETPLPKLNRTGHIALEVHCHRRSDPRGKDRWAPVAVRRWRNIGIDVP